MSIKGFSIFSSGGHFIQWSRTSFAILVEGNPRNISVNLKSVHWSRRRSNLKVFLFLALVAILFSGAEPFLQFWYRVIQGTFL